MAEATEKPKKQIIVKNNMSIETTMVNVYSTRDYDLFSILQGNRKIDRLHVEELKTSMKEKYLMKPIDVNEKYEIIDGQHRFTAASELKLPVYFIIHNEWGLSEVKKLNQLQKNWTTLHYLQAYVDLGYPEYVTFQDFYETFNFGIQVTYALLRNYKSLPRGEMFSDFRSGHFEVNNLEEATDTARKILSFEKYFSHVRREAFCLAIMRLVKEPDYNHEEMLNKLSMRPASLVPHTTYHDYVRNLEDIYNFKRHTGNIVRWF